MNTKVLEGGQTVYDPRGVVAAEPKPMAARMASLKGLRLGVLDNTKWNDARLLRKTIALLQEEVPSLGVSYYEKETYSKSAAPELIEQIAAENEAVLTGIGD